MEDDPTLANIYGSLLPTLWNEEPVRKYLGISDDSLSSVRMSSLCTVCMRIENLVFMTGNPCGIGGHCGGDWWPHELGESVRKYGVRQEGSRGRYYGVLAGCGALESAGANGVADVGRGGTRRVEPTMRSGWYPSKNNHASVHLIVSKDVLCFLQCVGVLRYLWSAWVV